jgi:outer membrane usher protein
MPALKPLALALLLALATPVAALPGDELLLLDLCVNDRCVGIATVIVRGEQVLIDREALRAAGIDRADLPGEAVDGRDYVSLTALNHGSRYAIDRQQLRLDLTLAAEHLSAQRIDLRERPQVDVLPQPWSAFVNYAGSFGQGGEHGLFLDAAVGRGQAALRSTGQWDATRGWARGLTRLEVDQPGQLRRWTAGDQFAIAHDPLGGGVLLGGIGVERAFEQDPYLVTFPQPFYSGVLESPGTVEVYANGVLIARRAVDAGPFTLDGLGIPPGRSDVQVVVRDPFGNRSQLDAAQYYGTSGLLAPGLTDYALHMGLPRRGGEFQDGYADSAALQGWVRRGLAESLTLGVRLEANRAFGNFGADAALRLPIGELGLAVAVSDHDRAGAGRAQALTYSYSTTRWGLALGARQLSAGYRNLAEPQLLAVPAPLARLREDGYANLSWSPAGPVTWQFNLGRRRYDGQASERSAGLSGSVRVSRRAQLLFGLQRREAASFTDTFGLISLSYALDRDNLSLSVRRNNDVDGYGLDAQRSRPPATGWGYDLSLQQSDPGTGSDFGQLEYQGQHGRYTAQAERFGAHTGGRLIASGALVAIGGRSYATPPLDTGFALARVPNLAGVPILRENVVVGHTDAHGDLLVRDLLPFYPSKLALDESQVPLGYTIRTPQRRVAVPRNTGALVLLDVQAQHGATGHIRLQQGATALPANYGSLVLERGELRFETVLGASGRFYLEDLPSGVYAVTVDSTGQQATCTLEMPPLATPGITDLGEVPCLSQSVPQEPAP